MRSYASIAIISPARGAAQEIRPFYSDKGIIVHADKSEPVQTIISCGRNSAPLIRQYLHQGCVLVAHILDQSHGASTFRDEPHLPLSAGPSRRCPPTASLLDVVTPFVIEGKISCALGKYFAILPRGVPKLTCFKVNLQLEQFSIAQK